MKHWKNRFFFIDRRAIPDAMVYRPLDAAIDDLRPAAGSYSMADVHRLSAHVIKLRDMPEGVLVLSGLIMGIHDFLCLPEWPVLRSRRSPILMLGPTLEDLAVSTPSSKILAKAKTFQKRKASTLGATLSHVAKRTSDGDDDACVKISLVTPLRSAAVIPSLGNQGRSSTAPAAEGPNTRDSRGKGIMADVAIAPSVDFFPFFDGPYYATYFEDGVARKCEFTQEEWDASYRLTFRVLTKEVFKDPAVCRSIVDQFPTSGVMVRVESLSDDQLTAKMSVLHCMMMSHGGELFARYHGLNQSHHEYVLSTDSKLKVYEEKVASLFGLELLVFTLKKQVSGLNDKLSSSDASFTKSQAKGKERKKKIKSLTKSVDNLYYEVARLLVSLNQATILEAKKMRKSFG
ncbi:hypothetical protein Tco_0721500 [Tanacetum coccineum]